MTTTTTLAPAQAPTSRRHPGSDVWDKLWHHRPSKSQDEANLKSEAKGPRWAAILRRVEETFGRVQGLRTIELGSGRGDVSLLLARRGARVTLVDYSDKALSEARLRFERFQLEAKFIRADLLGDLEDLVGRYDVALSYGVVEHFKGPDRTRAVRAHRRVLGDPGLAVISVPNAACLPYRVWKMYLEKRGWWPYGLEIPYTRTELADRAARAGFTRVETRTFGFRQFVAQHVGEGVLHREVARPQRQSWLDNVMGMALVMFGWTGPIQAERSLDPGVQR